MQRSSSVHARKKRDENGPWPMTAAVATFTDTREGISRALWKWAGDCKSACKRIARVADCSPRTAENWLAARNAPNAEGLIALMSESVEVTEEVLRLAGRLPTAERIRHYERVEAMLKTLEGEK